MLQGKCETRQNVIQDTNKHIRGFVSILCSISPSIIILSHAPKSLPFLDSHLITQIRQRYGNYGNLTLMII